MKAIAGSWAGCMGNPVKGKAWGGPAAMRLCERGKDRALCPRRSSSNMLDPLELGGIKESIKNAVGKVLENF